jgi:hypothetical protein
MKDAVAAQLPMSGMCGSSSVSIETSNHSADELGSREKPAKTMPLPLAATILQQFQPGRHAKMREKQRINV